ncbi:MAG TPA: KH domain-containing protein [Ktedonobacterales bacterium]|nr:KH domain-containing protein [Ktedonobacterales bacterium]
MEGLIEFLGRNLVDDPDAVEVRGLRNDRYATVVRLTVNAEDLGKVIGRQGRVAKSIRTLMRACATMQGKRHIGLELDEAPGTRLSPAPQPLEAEAEDVGELAVEVEGDEDAAQDGGASDSDAVEDGTDAGA